MSEELFLQVVVPLLGEFFFNLFYVVEIVLTDI